MTTLIEETSNRLLPRIILIACGSFSPPTHMHLRMFEIARDHFELNGWGNVIGGIVSPTHDSYGKKDLAPAKHRCAMVKLALKSSSWIRLSEWETQQETWSRTQTVLHYHKNYINNQIHILNENCDDGDNVLDWVPSNLHQQVGPIQLKLLCGGDLLQSFAVPGLWLDSDIEDIVSNHGLVVITRSGSNPEKFIFESDILSKYQNNITLITNWVPNEISSTVIRRLLSRGQSVKYLLNDAVINYIFEHGLYGSKNKTFEAISETCVLNNLHINQRYKINISSPDELNNIFDGSKDELDNMQTSDQILTKKNTHYNQKIRFVNKRDRPDECLSTSTKVQSIPEHHQEHHSASIYDEFIPQDNKRTSKKLKKA